MQSTFAFVCSVRAEEERREAARRLGEWREQQRKKEQQIQEQRLAEEIYQMRQAKVGLLGIVGVC